MQFLSDNAASVHPRVWEAMRSADAIDLPYDNDALSAGLDHAFSQVFGRPCAALWVASGTAANCLALAAMVQPHGGVICHAQAHIEHHEGGAPGFFTHGAKLILGQGAGSKIDAAEIERIWNGIGKDVHEVQPQAVSISQTSELGCTYRPAELAAISDSCQRFGLRLHVDGARFANAVAFLGVTPWEACAGADALSFGCIKNGAMSAEALVFFDPALAEVAKIRRKRAGHLQSKGRFLAAQLLAMLEDDLWRRVVGGLEHADARDQFGAGSPDCRSAEQGQVDVVVKSGPPHEERPDGGLGKGHVDQGARDRSVRPTVGAGGAGVRRAPGRHAHGHRRISVVSGLGARLPHCRAGTVGGRHAGHRAGPAGDLWTV